MKRFAFALGVLALLPSGSMAEPVRMDVRKTATCGCCMAWVSHVKTGNYQVAAENMELSPLAAFKRQHGIKSDLASCHTARVAGYTIEGHVPVREIDRLLKERPDAIGLTVPGMPLGSPGMEAGAERDAYDVLLIRKDGSTEVFAHYTKKP